MRPGLAALGTCDEEVFEELKNVLYSDDAVAGEAAGIGMGLLCAGSGSDAKAQEMLAYAHDTQVTRRRAARRRRRASCAHFGLFRPVLPCFARACFWWWWRVVQRGAARGSRRQCARAQEAAAAQHAHSRVARATAAASACLRTHTTSHTVRRAPLNRACCPSACPSALPPARLLPPPPQHEKIIRGLALGLALISYGTEEGADTLVEQVRARRCAA